MSEFNKLLESLRVGKKLKESNNKELNDFILSLLDDNEVYDQNVNGINYKVFVDIEDGPDGVEVPEGIRELHNSDIKDWNDDNMPIFNSEVNYDIFVLYSDIVILYVKSEIFNKLLNNKNLSGNNKTVGKSRSKLFKIEGDTLVDCNREAVGGELVVPDGIVKIGSQALSDCRKVKSIICPDSVKILDYQAMKNCRNLTSIKIPNVTSIGTWAFGMCYSLNNIELPASLTTIGTGAFHNCSSLESITIPDSVISIGSEAFTYCDSLKSITIGNSVKSIGWYAFAKCDKLNTIIYNGTKDQWSKIKLDKSAFKGAGAKIIKCTDGDIEVSSEG